MDVVKNPFAPGAGTPPPELAGREQLIAEAGAAILRVANGRPAQSLIMVGLRGVGKTVLLNRFEDMALAADCRTIFVEAHEGKTLAELLAPKLRQLLIALSANAAAKDFARKGMRALKGFLSGLKVTMTDVDFSLSIAKEAGLADSGDIEVDLPDLIGVIGEAAKLAQTPVVLILDEIQYFSLAEFSALIMAVHRASQKSLPVLALGAGLPQIRAMAGNSKSYAERLFRFPDIGALARQDAVEALQRPAQAEGAEFSAQAIDHILAATRAYPYFLQQWAYSAWNVSPTPQIDAQSARAADALAIAELDRSFFRMRFERCTAAEKKYMRALAQLGAGPQRSGDVAEKLGVKAQTAAPTRSALIKKGMIYSPSYGDTEFTVPLFDHYMRRVMPQWSRDDED